MRTSAHSRTKITCQWCNKEMDQNGRGRPRKFCSAACKQRAYEQRNAVSGTTIPEDAIIMSPKSAAELADGLFELRCGAQDIQTAVQEGAEVSEISQLCEEMVALARHLEELR
ncbi:hypothetical protein CCONF_05935 [Corynebacterium confusum]|nr:hypothetical protein [Corynebacterium confusum]WJY89721.1 hypothetical protein CCONF_05935 [Corynebacterium confusum]